MNVLEYIGTGRRNARTREELVQLTGWSDRQVRHEVARLRREGIPIMSSSDCPGYWIAVHIGEVEALLHEYDARMRTMRRDTAKLRKLVAEAHGQKLIQVSSYTRRTRRPLPSKREVEGQLAF